MHGHACAHGAREAQNSAVTVVWTAVIHPFEIVT